MRHSLLVWLWQPRWPLLWNQLGIYVSLCTKIFHYSTKTEINRLLKCVYTYIIIWIRLNWINFFPRVQWNIKTSLIIIQGIETVVIALNMTIANWRQTFPKLFSLHREKYSSTMFLNWEHAFLKNILVSMFSILKREKLNWVYLTTFWHTLLTGVKV